ncbi:hypothetical protein D1614_15310 [Maribellus luteus]|uniref:Uncharacterized protein n=1 Tax=Maribellus luteus TaxID=2305463 RepID=A0A399SYQ1_9BACT|nr:hypothetical protein D1614_15310 [Maribellus luteus]
MVPGVKLYENRNRGLKPLGAEVYLTPALMPGSKRRALLAGFSPNPSFSLDKSPPINFSWLGELPCTGKSFFHRVVISHTLKNQFFIAW